MAAPERWQQIKGYEGIYEVSDLGRVRRIQCVRKLSVDDVAEADNLRRNGMTFSNIAAHFKVSAASIIKALQKPAKRQAHRIPNRILKTQHASWHYPCVVLCKNGVPRTYSMHILVTRAFLGMPPKGMEVNHKDGDKKNSSLENLEYVTRSENATHSRNILKNKGGVFKGMNNKSHKLSDDDVLKIRDMHEWGAKQLVIAKTFRVCRDTIRKITKRIYWRHI